MSTERQQVDFHSYAIFSPAIERSRLWKMRNISVYMSLFHYSCMKNKSYTLFEAQTKCSQGFDILWYQHYKFHTLRWIERNRMNRICVFRQWKFACNVFKSKESSKSYAIFTCFSFVRKLNDKISHFLILSYILLQKILLIKQLCKLFLGFFLIINVENLALHLNLLTCKSTLTSQN